MYRKPNLLTILVATALLASLVACQAQLPAAPQAQPVAVEKPQTMGDQTTLSGFIDFWVYEPDPGKPEAVSTLDNLKREFETANPGTKVNIIPIPKNDFNTKLNAAIAAKTAPDASYLDQPLVARFALDGVLDQMPAGLLDESTLYQGALNTNRVNGKLYGLPLSQTCVALYYNKDFVPNPPKNWDEMLAVAKQVYSEENRIAAFELPRGGWGAWLFPGFVTTAGGTMLDESKKVIGFSQQPAVDALTLWKELLPYSPRDITDGQNAFQTGHIAMKISGPWEIDGLKNDWPDLNWGVTLIPAKVANGSNIGGDNAVVYSTSQNKALAWAWLKFLTDPEPNLALSLKVMGNFPINLADASGEWLKDSPELQVFMEQMKYAQARPTVPDWLKINDELVAKAIDDVLDNNVSPVDALDEAAEKAKQILGW
jgi:multiple sugar transport system substrate-binding protein